MPPTDTHERRRSRRERRSSGGRTRVRRAAGIAAPITLGVCLVIAPQLLGGVYGWGIAIIAALAGFAALAAAWAARADGLKAPVDLPGAALVAALGWTVLQAVPLPRALTELAQPEAVEMAQTAAKLVETSEPAWVPLSISPGSTRAEIVKGSAIVAVFFAAWLLASLGHRRRVTQLVAFSTLTMALVALAHLAAGATRIFGLYEPIDVRSGFLAPLINANHLSGFLAMGVPVFVGLGLDEDERGARIGYLVGATVVGASALLAASRGGVAALVCGLLALGALGLARRRQGPARDLGTTYASIGATVAAIAGLGLYVGAEALFHDFEHGDASKIELGIDGVALAIEHPWVGVGRGAFSAAFVHAHGQNVRYTNPENLVAQWTSEWGLVAGVVVIAILGFAIVRAIGAANSWNRLGAAAGIVAIVVHDLVDFALEMAGVAVVGAALLAAVLAPRRSSRDRTERGVRAWQLGGATGVAALAAVAVLGWRIDADSVLSLQQRLEALNEENDRDAFHDVLVDAIRLHPAEPVFPLLGGAEATHHGDARAIAWLNRAMVLAPGWPSPHAEIARFLARTGRVGQAFLEVREAEERMPGSGFALACTIVGQQPTTAGELVRVFGDEGLGDRVLDNVARCLPVEHGAAMEIDAHLAGHGVLGAAVRKARRELDGGAAVDALATLEPVRAERDLDVQLTRARALVRLRRYAHASRVLARAERLTDRPEGVLRLRAQVEAESGDAEAMRRTAARLRGLAGGQSRLIADAWVFEGRLEESLGNDGHALADYERAHRADPSSGGLVAVASLSERMGNLGRAFLAYGELCRRAGAESPHCAARERVRRRMTESPAFAAQPLGAP